jgi:AcrR family transcriptional regulator
MVQVLKEEIRLAILQVAREEFLEKGFGAASVKGIAKKVGISVGNVYRYYPNKEALFEAVALPTYQAFVALLQGHERVEEAMKQGALGGEALEMLGSVLTEFLFEFREGILLLLYGAAGTKYEGFKEELFARMTEHVKEHLASSRLQMGKEVARPVAVAFLEGYFEIVRMHADREKIRELTREYVKLWFGGLQMLV